MSGATFHGKRVVDSGPGQCVHCAARIYRVLVAETSGVSRTWHNAEIGGTGWVAHRCPPAPPPQDEPLPRAA